MIFRNVELHNIAGITELWNGSLQLQRVPEDVRLCLNPAAQERALHAANAEIRFVCDSPKAKITLSSPAGSGQFLVGHGTFLSPSGFPVSGSKLTIELEIPENLRCLKPEQADDLAFDPRVFRILLPNQPIIFFEAEGDNLRPPAPEQLPSLRYLAYGTSITEGGCATSPHLAYVAQAARRLGADLLNLGMSGSCQCEKEMADHIAGRTDWHIATLALSVNMMEFSVEEFSKRVNYAVNTIAGADTTRPVACITLFPYFTGACTNHEAEEDKAARFRQELRDAVAHCPHPNVHLIEGAEILDQLDGLTADVIHPSDYGMMRMGENLAERLAKLLP